jgi:hypothetical protein
MSEPASSDKHAGRPARDDGSAALDALLKSQAPPDLADGGFTARAMKAIARASAPSTPGVSAAPHDALAAARALLLEQRRYAAQARLWRWGMAGVLVGAAMLVCAVLGAPVDVAAQVGADPASASVSPQWAPLWGLAMAAAVWFAWRQVRSE